MKNKKLILWSITSALAGFLFGFDTVVISGAEQMIQKVWGLTAGMHGFALASALYGTVLGAVFGGFALGGGHLAALFQPIELLTIGGSAIGAFVVGNTPCSRSLFWIFISFCYKRQHTN